MLPSTIPIFPLPTVVLFPNVFLPLHIFERRYRQMVTEAIAGDRLIGMVLLQPGFDTEYEACPPTYDVGCAGLITHAERLPDGRFNIVLRGMEKFRIIAEDTAQAYRLAQVEAVPEPVGDAVRMEMGAERRRLESLLVPQPEGQRPASAGRDPAVPTSMADEDLVNALAQYLEFEPVEKQALLERDGVLNRCRSLIELLEMKVLVARHTWGSGN